MSQRKAANRWKPDTEAQACSSCQTKFHLLCRRHHCRQCGDIFCNDCSSKKRVVPIVHPTEAQRVCTKCWQIARNPGLGSSMGSSPIGPGASLVGPPHAIGGRRVSNLSTTSNPHNSTTDGPRGGQQRTPGLNVLNPIDYGGSESRQGSIVSTPGSNSRAYGMGRGTSTPADSNSSVINSLAPQPTEIKAGDEYYQPQTVQLEAEQQQQQQQLQPPAPSFFNNSQRTAVSNTSFPTAIESGMCIIPPDDMCSTSSDDDGDFDDNMTGTPPSMRQTLLSSKGAQMDASSPSNNAAGGALSFLAALEDATRIRASSGQMTLPVLLYVTQGHELPIVANIDAADEIVEDMIAKLTPRYYELKFGVRRRPKGNDLEDLRHKLQFVNESGRTIPKDIPLSDLCRRQERVVLATIDTVIHHQKTGGSTRSLTVHSGFFMQSERSEESNDDDTMMEA